MKFIAIDFETADYRSDSACAVAMVKVEHGTITQRFSCLIKPPRREFIFTYIHNICWEDVETQPTFSELWPELSKWFINIDFLVAHNARFDSRVLATCCEHSNIIPPKIPFKCTVEIARSVWGIYPTKLPNVCARLNIPLKHHDPVSDAEACANIMIKALQGKKSIK